MGIIVHTFAKTNAMTITPRIGCTVPAYQNDRINISVAQYISLHKLKTCLKRIIYQSFMSQF